MSDPAFDVVVAGAGAAGLTAAAVAAAHGRRVLLLERAPLVGGTTAISGGMVWLPVNHKAAEEGRPDSPAAAHAYLDATVARRDDGRHAALLDTFVDRGDEALRYLEAHTALRLRPVPTYPDYYPTLPGATTGGRVLEPVPFDGRELGAAFRALRLPLPEFMLFGSMMISREDIPHLRRFSRSAASAWRVARLLARHARQRLGSHRGTTLYLGNALAARLWKSVLDLGVTVRLGTPIARLLNEGGRVVGVEVAVDGRSERILAQRGVILATGGCSHDAALRRRFVTPQAGDLSATIGDASVAGGVRLAEAAGARLSAPAADQAFWVPASTFRRADGSAALFPHTVTDRGKPGLIAVDRDGCRFVNEAVSYHEFVRAQLQRPDTAIPAWLVCDRAFLWRYGLGRIKPFTPAFARPDDGQYLKQGASLAELAGAIGVPPQRFLQTVEAFNADARAGVDRAFGRGSDAYQRHLGDAQCRPNPCVAPIVEPPFFAVAVRPADLGMAAGIATDASARVLGTGGEPIEGLFACGNDMESIMNGAYPGPGITLGPALVFGYLAALAAAR